MCSSVSQWRAAEHIFSPHSFHNVHIVDNLHLSKLLFIEEMRNLNFSFMWFQHDSETLGVGKTAIANMLGGIGYFYGQSKIYVPKSTQVSLFPSCILFISFISLLCSSHLQTRLDLSQNHTI